MADYVRLHNGNTIKQSTRKSLKPYGACLVIGPNRPSQLYASPSHFGSHLVQGQSQQPNFGSANAEYKHIEEGIDGSFGMMELLAAFWLGRLAAMSRRVNIH